MRNLTQSFATEESNVPGTTADQSVEAGRNTVTEAGNPQRCYDSRKNVQGVMRPQDQNRSDFENDQQDRQNRQPIAVQPGQLDGTEHRNRGMPGEEKIVGDVIGHEKRGETRVVPDHVRWRRQCTDRLHRLAKGHEQEQSEERAHTSAKEPAPQKKKSQRIDQTRAYDQQRVRGSGVSRKI